MNQEEKLQRLLRLKRHEKPAEDYFEDFLAEFHRRQRANAAAPRHGFFERMKTGAASVMEVLRRPAVGWGAVTACGVALMVLSQRPLSTTPGSSPATARETPAASAPARSVPAADTRLVNDGTPLLPAPPPGKPRTKDQTRDVKSLIGPALPAPTAGE